MQIGSPSLWRKEMTVNVVGKPAGLTSPLNCQELEKQENDSRDTADNRIKSLRLEHSEAY